jgi:hypothetical protein
MTLHWLNHDELDLPSSFSAGAGFPARPCRCATGSGIDRIRAARGEQLLDAAPPRGALA